MSTTTAQRTRRTYRFRDRAQAEEHYVTAEQGRLRAEWFASAILQGRTHLVGTTTDGYRKLRIGWFTTVHSAIVFAISDDKPPHCIRGIWDIDDDLGNVIAALMRYEDSHEFGRLLDKARQSAWKAMMA